VEGTPRTTFSKRCATLRDFLRAHHPVDSRPLRQAVWRRSTAPPCPPCGRMWRTAARVFSANASVSDGIGNRGIVSLLPLRPQDHACARMLGPQRPLVLGSSTWVCCVGFGVTVSTFTPVSDVKRCQPAPGTRPPACLPDSSRDCMTASTIMSKAGLPLQRICTTSFPCGWRSHPLLPLKCVA